MLTFVNNTIWGQKMTDKTKVYGFRLTPEKIEEFENACNNLPIHFKPNELLRGYIDYIINTSKKYKQTGNVKMGFLTYDSSIVILNLEGTQTQINFDEF